MDIILVPNFWDCNCEKGFIHPKSEPTCLLCGAELLDEDGNDNGHHPDSRIGEILNLTSLSESAIRSLGADLEVSEDEIESLVVFGHATGLDAHEIESIRQDHLWEKSL